jgi:hypothetical protein
VSTELPLRPALRTGWTAILTALTLAGLVFLTLTGLAITLFPFHAAVQWGLLAHAAVGAALLIPLLRYAWRHWLDYRDKAASDAVVLGYVSLAAFAVCLLSGAVVTWQGLFGVRMSPIWRQLHLYSTLGLVATGAPHLVIAWVRSSRRLAAPPVQRIVLGTHGLGLFAAAACGALALAYAGPRYADQFPEDYTFVYGEDRPFAPSLARTSTGSAFDPRRLSGSESCGTAGCHEQIVEEWRPSAHRYAAMDPLFQGIQAVMAEQNGSESTRYCGGCHDPISLFAGAKTTFQEELTHRHGYQEGVSCLACHAIRETDVQGNADYVTSQPADYLWQWSDSGLARVARDFLIRTYPDEHLLLSKRMYKAPEYCAACHKQFIDQEVNNVGWVQLQNQYDNWKASRWYHEGDASKTIECRECHMPLVASSDPAAGDGADYNRSPGDARHRSHRFIGANSMVPEMLKLEGWEEQVRLTRLWLSGQYEVPEIQDKWMTGPVIGLELEVPEVARPGETVPIRVVLVANKVGHDFPTGPLDIIQSWVELHVTDDAGNPVFSTGRRDEKHFIEPGSFLFKAEPVDQYGNLIDRHNLWEMVGVRYRRALFPGYSDSVEYLVACPSSLGAGGAGPASRESERVHELAAPRLSGRLHVTARLNYRKVDQFLLNYLLGEDSGVTAPVLEMTETSAVIEVRAPGADRATAADGL